VTLQRVNDSVLGAWERPALRWMAARMPAGVVPDHLTAFGALGASLTAAGYVLSQGSLAWLWLASAGLIANWLGDSLDGTLARQRRIERPRYGFFLDHTSDLFCQALTFLSLGISPLVHFGMACLALITFLMAFVCSLITAQTRATMRITYCHFGPTEIRALLLCGNLLSLAFGVVELPRWFAVLPGGGSVSIHDAFIALIAAAGVVVIALLSWRDARALNVEDPPPR
jgi:archaetidylinositol phosphate synthase